MAMIQIIVTPGSGSGLALSSARRVQQALRVRGYVARVQIFRDLGSLARWAGTCKRTFSHLVAVGGDSTFSAAAAAAVRLSLPFVPVPSGFGNLFASAFEHPRDPEAVVDLLQRGELLGLDVGVARSGLSLCHESYGPLTRIQHAVERGRRYPRQRYLRQLAYYRTAARWFADGVLDTIHVEVDGRVVADEAALVTVANVETYRGFLSLTPAASPVDGLLDVCVIPRMTTARLFARLLRLMFRLPGRWEEVGLHRGRLVRVSVNGRSPEEIRILEGVLPTLVPPGSLERLEARREAAEAELSVLMAADAGLPGASLEALTAAAPSGPPEGGPRRSAPGRSRARRRRSRPPVGFAAGD